MLDRVGNKMRAGRAAGGSVRAEGKGDLLTKDRAALDVRPKCQCQGTEGVQKEKAFRCCCYDLKGERASPGSNHSE